jgi:hypothetical protein
MKKIKHISLLLIPYTIYLILNTGIVRAQSSSNDIYQIEVTEIDTSPNTTVVAPRNPDPTPEKKEEEVAKKSGIESIAQTAPLSFSISSSLVDFGPLTPGNPVTRNLLLSALSESMDFQIIGFEDRSLTGAKVTETIPDVTCDMGNCDETTDGEWKNQLTYGYGYRCKNLKLFVCAAFSEGEFFKQFSDRSKGEDPQTILTGKKSSQEQQAEILFKLNTSGTQKEEKYTNTVTFIAVPNF